MTEAEKNEREEVFLWCALRNETERELWRKYGTLRADELPDDSGEPFLKRKMFEILVQLAEAGFGEDDWPMPFEHPKCDVDARKMMSMAWPDNNSFPKVSFNFAVLRGGRVAGYDPAPWWKAVEELFDDERLGGWRLNDERLAVRFYTGHEWWEVHKRCEMPSIIEAFKAEIKAYLRNVWTDGNGKPCDIEGATFPMRERIVFEINCIGGLKVYRPTNDGFGWVSLEAFPLTNSKDNAITPQGGRKIIRRQR